MPSAFAWHLAFRFLLTRWVNLLSATGVAVAVWALIVVIAVFSGFIGDIRDNLHSATPDLLVTDLPADQDEAPVRAVTDADPDVIASAPRAEHYGVIFYRGRRIELLPTQNTREAEPADINFVRVLGIDAQAEARTTGLTAWLEGVRPAARVGNLEQPFAIEDEVARTGLAISAPDIDPNLRFDGILLGEHRLRDSDWGADYQRGRMLDLVSARFVEGDDGMEPAEIKASFQEAGAFASRHRTFEATTALVPIESVRTMLGHDAEDEESVALVTSVALKLADNANITAARQRIADSLAAADISCRVLTWEQQNATFLGAVDQERNMMKVVLFAVMLIAAFLIYATLHMMVVQKTKDIGVLSALGGDRGSIQGTFLICGFVIGMLGCTLGAALGLLSLVYLNPFNDWLYDTYGLELFPRTLYDLPEIPWRLEPTWLVQVLVGALLLTLFVAWLPARRAARMRPVEALSYE